MFAYVSIGNSDDKLTQAEWSNFILDMSAEVASLGKMHGAWFSGPASPYQNACWCIEFGGPDAQATANVVAEAKELTAKLARKYRQDSIAWARVAETEFIS
jgi:hypothetical protein